MCGSSTFTRPMRKESRACANPLRTRDIRGFLRHRARDPAVKFDHRDPGFLELVARKLNVTDDPVNLLGGRRANLRSQLTTDLQPVLRAADYDALPWSERLLYFKKSSTFIHRSAEVPLFEQKNSGSFPPKNGHAVASFGDAPTPVSVNRSRRSPRFFLDTS